MKAKIEIECDSIGELLSHLSEIRRKVKLTAKNQGIDLKETFHKTKLIEDSNCYGDHKCRITNN